MSALKPLSCRRLRCACAPLPDSYAADARQKFLLHKEKFFAVLDAYAPAQRLLRQAYAERKCGKFFLAGSMSPSMFVPKIKAYTKLPLIRLRVPKRHNTASERSLANNPKLD